MSRGKIAHHFAMLVDQLRVSRTVPTSPRGASMVEYALLLIFVFAVAMVSLQVFGESVVAIFESGTTSFEPATQGAN